MPTRRVFWRGTWVLLAAALSSCTTQVVREARVFPESERAFLALDYTPGTPTIRRFDGERFIYPAFGGRLAFAPGPHNVAATIAGSTEEFLLRFEARPGRTYKLIHDPNSNKVLVVDRDQFESKQR